MRVLMTNLQDQRIDSVLSSDDQNRLDIIFHNGNIHCGQELLAYSVNRLERESHDCFF